jgi:protein-arginine kinase activator protein McsA
MKLIIPLKRDKKYLPTLHKIENEFFERNFKKEKLDYIKRNILENDLDDFSSFRVMLNSKVAVSLRTTLLRDKLATGGKILSCNLTKIDYYNFSVNGICTLNNCSYEEFEKRLLEIYSISKENYFSKINAKPDYLQKFSKNYSTIDLIREKLSELGVNQNF